MSPQEITAIIVFVHTASTKNMNHFQEAAKKFRSDMEAAVAVKVSAKPSPDDAFEATMAEQRALLVDLIEKMQSQPEPVKLPTMVERMGVPISDLMKLHAVFARHADQDAISASIASLIKQLVEVHPPLEFNTSSLIDALYLRDEARKIWEKYESKVGLRHWRDAHYVLGRLAVAMIERWDEFMFGSVKPFSAAEDKPEPKQFPGTKPMPTHTEMVSRYGPLAGLICAGIDLKGSNASIVSHVAAKGYSIDASIIELVRNLRTAVKVQNPEIAIKRGGGKGMIAATEDDIRKINDAGRAGVFAHLLSNPNAEV